MLLDNNCNPLEHIMEYRSFSVALGSRGRPMVRVKTNMSACIKGDEFCGPSVAHKPYPEDSSTYWKDLLPEIIAAARNKTIPHSQPADADQERLEKYVEGIYRLEEISDELYPRAHKISDLALLWS